MEGSNGLVSEFCLFLNVGEGFRGIGVGRWGTRREGELCSNFFLAESDGFRLAQMNFSTRILYTAKLRVTLSFRVLDLDGAGRPDFCCSSVQWLETCFD